MKMKLKRLLGFLLSILLVLGAVPGMSMTAYAEDALAIYPLWVGGVQVTSTNADNILGDNTTSYDDSTKTLTLNGATITDGYTEDSVTNGIYYNPGNDFVTLNINLETGTTNISNLDYGIGGSTHASFAISGEGTLSVNASKSGIFSQNNITISGGNLSLSSTGNNGAGISAEIGLLTISGGTVTASPTGNNSMGIVAQNINFTGGVVTASGKMKAVSGDVGITLGENVTVKAGADEASAVPVDAIGDQKWVRIEKEVAYNVIIADDIQCGGVAADKSSAKAGETVTLTATPDTDCNLLSIGAKAGRAETVADIIAAIGRASFTNGDDTVTVSENSLKISSYSIAAENTITRWTDVYFTAMDDEYNSWSFTLSGETGKITSISFSSSSGTFFGTCSGESEYFLIKPVVLTPDTTNPNVYTFSMPAAPVTVSAEFEKLYPLWVGGTQVTGTNLGSWDWIFDPDTATLELWGATITGDYHSAAIYAESMDLIINVNSDSTVTGPDGGYGIWVNSSDDGSRSITINGDGRLSVTGGSTCVKVSGSITVNGTLSAATGTTGNDDKYGVDGDIVIKEGAVVNVTGTTRAIKGTVSNAIAGLGWTDVSGVEGEAVIDVSEGQALNDYKKVQFPCYTVTFNTEGGEPEIMPGLVAVGSTIDAPTTPTKENMAFTGWFDGTNLVTFPYTPPGDVTLTAQWTDAVASITRNGKTSYYATLQEAFDMAVDDDIVRMISDVMMERDLFVRNKRITLDLNDHGLFIKYSCIGYKILWVENSGSLTLTDNAENKTVHNIEMGMSGEMYLPEDKPLYRGWFPASGDDGKKTIEVTGGYIAGGYASGGSGGGGVRVKSGSSFTMTGGTICACTTSKTYAGLGDSGGGVYVDADGSFTMTGGTIRDNNSYGNGGGVYVAGTFTMTGGTIRNNISYENGGGVYVNGGSFTMTGGTISGNLATEHGGGVYVNKGGTFNLSGNVDISDNKVNGSGNNVQLDSNVITVQGRLENTKPIGVTAGEGVDITSGFKTKMPNDDPAEFFESDINGWKVLWNSNNTEATMGSAVTVTFNSNIPSVPGTKKQNVLLNTETELQANPFTWPGYSFTAWNTKADGTGTKYADKAKVKLSENLELYARWDASVLTVSPIADQTWTGQPITPTVTVKDGDTTLTLDTDYTVDYKDNTNAGTATVTVTGKGVYKDSKAVDVTFKILKAVSRVTSAPTAKTLTYNGSAQKLVKAGVAEGGTMQYAIGKDDKTAPTDGWKTSIPTATEAGTYYVWYRVIGDDDHFDFAPDYVKAVISDYAEMPDDWNLFEDDSEHEYPVYGIFANVEYPVPNTNKKSAKYYDATLDGSTITVKLKEELGKGDRKKASNASNAILEFNLGADGVVEYMIPVSYVKPVFKLSSTSGTIKKGTESVLKTSLLIKGEGGGFGPYDIEDVEVTGTGFKSVVKGADDAIEITANAAGKGKINIYKEGWDKTDPVSLKYTVKTSQKDVLTVDIGNQKIIDVNTNAKGQVLSFDISLNGEAPDDEDVTLTDNTGLARVEDGKLVVEYKEGVKNGKYTVTLEAGDAKTMVKINVSNVALDKCIKLKVKRKLNVVTGQSMIVRPDMTRNLNVGIVSANVLEEGFRADLDSVGDIAINYEGEKYNADHLNIGNLTLELYIGGIDEPVTMTLKNVKAAKTLPLVKAPAVVIPKESASEDDKVIGTANIVSYVKLANGRMKLVDPLKAEIEAPKNVTAAVNPDDNTEIDITSLTKKSGTIKVKLTYKDELTKNVTIKVRRAK